MQFSIAMEDLRNALQNKIRKLPVRYFDNHHYGDVLSRITNDVDAISNASTTKFYADRQWSINAYFSVNYDVYD